MKVLLLSDIHGNIEALNTVINSVESVDIVIFLGDSVDYGPSPGEVVDWLKENADYAVMGNHDKAVAFNIDCMCGEKTHELSVYTRENISFKLLKEDHLAFLRRLPEKQSLDIEGIEIKLSHGSPFNPLYGYVFPNQDLEKLKKMLLYEKDSSGNSVPIREDVILIGHSHIQFKMDIEGKKVANPGSVGQPRDGDWRAAFALFDINRGEIEFRRVKYPVEKTVEKIKKLGLEKRFREMLVYILRNGKLP